jgi:hypothetical protein
MTVQTLKKPVPFPQQEDLAFHIHGFLSHKDTASTSAVCLLWNKVAKDPRIWTNSNLERVFFPNLSIIDEAVWQAHVDCPTLGLNTTFTPKDKAAAKINAIIVMRQFNAYSKVEKNQGFTLLTIPQGLTLKIIKQIAQSPMKGNTFYLDDSYASYFPESHKTVAEKPYQIIISNNVFSGSRVPHIKTLVDHYKKCGLEIPKLLEVAALCALTYIGSTPPLYLLEEGTYTICSDTVLHCDIVTIGKFKKEYINNLGDKTRARLHLTPRPYHKWDKEIGIMVMKTIFPAQQST